MKKRLLSLLLVLPWLLLPTACEEEHDDVRPGLYAAQEVIETFPGDTVTVIDHEGDGVIDIVLVTAIQTEPETPEA